ncbi:hypothetical protein [Actinopolymorpha pittospori]|uniref:Uncharacterized protein n=1 Tax=Actinopolymorpha pittospori TaxID=648752 RepID=A0A927REI0_9ACTN|nr:hypothetical protein [Actinopolymorpha pittospori]MBE1609210.1 hypothetical protein [Actinopolymorpha pittospori]
MERVEGCAVRLVDPERVADVRTRMPAENDVVDTADVFGLLADPGRPAGGTARR